MAAKKSLDRGYWVSKLFYYQSMVYLYLYAFKFRSFSFFTAANPSMSMGGMLDDKKSATYDLLPTHTYPKTFVNQDRNGLIEQLHNSNIKFPIIVKPDVGYKGYLVKKVTAEEELLQIMADYNNEPILVQDFVDFKREFSILIYRFPNSGEIGISSLIEKTYPIVTGDGQSTLLELIMNNANPFLKKDWIVHSFEGRHDEVPVAGMEIQIDEIGNYSRGAKFHSKNEFIDDKIIKWADNLLSDISGLNFCRIDIKANSLDSLIKGHFKILEINGAKSEPLHIYDPKYSYFQIVKEIHRHWKLFKTVIEQNVSKSFNFPRFSEVYKSWVIAKNLVK